MMKLLLTTIKNDCLHSKLALKNLYGVVSDAPIDITVREFDDAFSDIEVYEEIAMGGYNIVYFHTNMLNRRKIDTVCEMLKKAAPTTIIATGGMEVTFETEKYMRENPAVDFVFRGEPETVMFEFLKTVITYEFGFENIPGLAYRSDDEIKVSPIAPPVELDDLPFPYDKFEVEEGEDVYYESARGCPDRCAYSQYLSEARIRTRSLNKVCTELRYFLAKEAGAVYFTDKWFNFNPDRAYRIWDYIINNDNDVTSFVFDVNGDFLDEETIRLLGTARKGLFRFNLDLESSNSEALAAVGRKENIYQMLYNLVQLQHYETVDINLSIKLGLPYDDPEKFARTFNKVYGMPGATFDASVLSLRKGTLLRHEAEKFGYIYSSIPPYEVIANDFIQALDMIKIKKTLETAGRYLEDGMFSNSLPRLMTDIAISPFNLFGELSAFIYENSYIDKIVRRKENLYRVLYAYAVGKYDELSETLKLQLLLEALHADLEEHFSEDEVKKFDKKGWDI